MILHPLEAMHLLTKKYQEYNYLRNTEQHTPMKITASILGATVVFMASLAAINPDSEPAINIAIPAVTKASPMQMTGGELLINKSDCVGCHHKINKLIGPSYTEIAKKYPNTEKNITLLASKIITGGSGVWGKIPMTPHPKITNNDAKLMAKYILALKKKQTTQNRT